MSEAVAQYIEESLDLLRTEGWCTDTLSQEDGSRCAFGALYKTPIHHLGDTFKIAGDGVEVGGVVLTQAVRALANAIPQDSNHPLDVASYNNTRTDFAEIEVWFKQAAANERENV